VGFFGFFLFSSCEVRITLSFYSESITKVELLMISYHGKCFFEVALFKK